MSRTNTEKEQQQQQQSWMTAVYAVLSLSLFLVMFGFVLVLDNVTPGISYTCVILGGSMMLMCVVLSVVKQLGGRKRGLLVLHQPTEIPGPTTTIPPECWVSIIHLSTTRRVSRSSSLSLGSILPHPHHPPPPPPPPPPPAAAPHYQQHTQQPLPGPDIILPSLLLPVNVFRHISTCVSCGRCAGGSSSVELNLTTTSQVNILKRVPDQCVGVLYIGVLVCDSTLKT
nr:uncharacterized protein LOC128694219 [Cherax quadricarinatus]XP_053640195.1 uncharacterized protein LOC128694219 [Cherax quadricarinatus]